MSCFHPLLRAPKLELVPDPYFPAPGHTSKMWSPVLNYDGEVIFSVHALSTRQYEWIHSDDDLPPLSSMSDIELAALRLGQLVPCGHCVGCKLDYSREWADRMLMELQSAQGKGLFVTLTYDDVHVPRSSYTDSNGTEHCNYTLRKSDFQAWLKRLRKYFSGDGDYSYPLRRIRYYGAGEYGEMTLRPHGHFILFGIDLDDVQAVPALTPLGDPVVNRNGDPYYRSSILEKSWPFGMVSVAKVTWRSAAYVARYVTKKWSSGYGDTSTGDLYKLFGVEPEFSVMSLKPGIGAKFFDDWCAAHPDDCILDYSALSSPSEDAHKLRIPKYFKAKFRDSDDSFLRAKYRACCEASGRRAEARTALKLDRSDLDFLSYLEGEESHLISQTHILRRDKV